MRHFSTPNGFLIESDNRMLTIKTESGLEVASYHPELGQTILGYHSPKNILHITEALDYAKHIVFFGNQSKPEWEFSY